MLKNPSKNTTIILTRNQKGRIGEDAVCFGFRKLGFNIFRTGLEHTNLVNLSRNEAICHNALFQQQRKIPDFLITKGKHSYFVEVKLRTTLQAPTDMKFMGDLIDTYLGTPIESSVGNNTSRSCRRTAQRYFNIYEDVLILLLLPKSVHIARLGDILWGYERGSGLSHNWEYAWEAVKTNTWEQLKKEQTGDRRNEMTKMIERRIESLIYFGTHWVKFLQYYETIKPPLEIEDWDRRLGSGYGFGSP